MKGSFRDVTREQVSDSRSANQRTIEKSMHMRTLAYLAEVKASLLTQTIFEIGKSKKNVSSLNRKLEYSHSHLEREVDKRTRSLQESEAKYRMLFESSSDAIMVFRENGFIDCNSATLDIFDCKSRAQFLGRHPAEFSPLTQPSGENSLELANAYMAEALNHGSKQFEWVHQRLDGTEFYADVRLTAFELNGANAMQAIVRDISEQKSREQELKKLTCCVQQAGESILITDTNGVIEYVNPAFTRLTGYTSEDVIGNNARILKSGKHDNFFYQTLWQTISSGQIWRGKVIDKRRDGSLYPAFMTISPVSIGENAGDETFTHYVGIQSDLSQIEDIEARFHQAQKLEAIGTLVGGIAHDFNNMLAGITGNIFLAKSNAQDYAGLMRNLDSVEKLSFRAAEMISQLLAFARKSTVSMKEIPLTAYLKEVVKLLSVSVPENVNLKLNCCGDNLMVHGDSTMIHQIIMNLMNNARDALDGVDNPTITIAIEPFTADKDFAQTYPYQVNEGEFAHISVQDNGCGIAPDQIDKVFDPFFTTKEQGKGTGLGLAMVYGAVKKHNGYIDVESNPEQGTTFHLYLPILEKQEDSAVSTNASEVVKGRGESILLVDDEENLLMTSSNVLERLNYRVLTATNGQEAVDLFRAHSDEIDLVILDVIMPVLGGVEACRLMRESCPDVKVIFSTGYDKEQALSQHASDDTEIVLVKPFSIHDLSHAVRDSLDC